MTFISYRIYCLWLTHEVWAEIWWIRLSSILVGSRILPAISDQNSELGLGILLILGQTFGPSNPPQHYFHWESFWLYDLLCLLYQSSMFLEYLDLGTLRQSNWNWKKGDTDYSFWDRLHDFLHKFTWIVFSFHNWTNWVNFGKFMDNSWISCQVMADMQNFYDNLIIINL